MEIIFIRIWRFLTDRCLECGIKYEYGSFGYGCGFKYCPKCFGIGE